MIFQPTLSGYAWQRMTVQLPLILMSLVLLERNNLPKTMKSAAILYSQALRWETTVRVRQVVKVQLMNLDERHT